MRRTLTALCLLACGAAHPSDAASVPDEGTTVVGDRETALGLVLMPWQDEEPAALDRAPALLDESPAPVEPAAHERATRFEQDLAGWRRARVEHSR